ncbi:unnamed protein product, partial [Ostreobium quekettii]
MVLAQFQLAWPTVSATVIDMTKKHQMYCRSLPNFFLPKVLHPNLVVFTHCLLRSFLLQEDVCVLPVEDRRRFAAMRYFSIIGSKEVKDAGCLLPEYP